MKLIKLFFKLLCVIIWFVSSQVFAKTTLYEVTDHEGKIHFVFGTFHSDDRRVTSFNENLLVTIKNSNLFLMETDELSDLKHIETNINFIDQLNEDELDSLKQLSDFHVMFFDRITKMKPWLLAFILDSPRPATPFNQDNLLKRYAEDSGILTRGLMSTSDHFSALDFLTDEEQILLLKNSLMTPMEIKEKNYEKLIQVYMDGDLDLIMNTNESMTSEIMSENLWNKIKQKILIDRNHIFNQQIYEAMKQDNIFVAIGASHLSGHSGVLSFLKDKGFEIKNINY
jgi:uncharacterized protein YbaP (TraB family)